MVLAKIDEKIRRQLTKKEDKRRKILDETAQIAIN